MYVQLLNWHIVIVQKIVAIIIKKQALFFTLGLCSDLGIIYTQVKL